MTAFRNDALLDTIITLAEQIAQASPECAQKAVQIVDLVSELSAEDLDRSAIQDAIEIEMADSDLSDVRVINATDAVLKAARER